VKESVGRPSVRRIAAGVWRRAAQIDVGRQVVHVNWSRLVIIISTFPRPPAHTHRHIDTLTPGLTIDTDSGTNTQTETGTQTETQRNTH